MKTIKYTVGIIAMVVTFSSCTVEELELASAAGVIITEQTTDSSTQNTESSAQHKEGDIDPPTPPTKP
ncbi:hypothetical protein [Flavobacterium sp. GT3R68]|uniref:hypothetical protein n=1 Tax=Flavobacterium sp. GT3R68 TaxID=2594437 RepID=UPI000F85E36A|nr:hypothetical protein [Flavobacterium sp. GT3R68]RTY95831.1 hypothetical protein EKL32_04085 [Flavobacterium sp. GSN2]TRW93603.1 hypothetical protein FNW07_01475 [Flavobacterium sp. GT3R68]